jgi:glycosyltransferase involved in cell wall biosynthesis
MNKENKNYQPKILYSTNIAGLGGGETSLVNLLSSLQNHNFNPILVCPPGKLENRASRLGITTISLEFPPIRLYAGFIPLFSPLTIFKIILLIKKYKIDIVHVESLLSLFYCGSAALIANVPCVATYHGFWLLNQRPNRALLKLCQRLYPVSKTTAIDLDGIVPDFKIRLIPLGINLHFFDKLPSKTECRITYGLPLNKPIIMQIGRFQPIKGQMILLEALAEIIRSKKCSIPLVVYVGGILDTQTDEAVLYKQTVEKRALKDDLRGNVRFLGWQEDIPKLMQAADIVITPSDYETFSLVTVEAMAVGKLVIATSCGGPSEIIQDQLTGILIPPQNPIALAEAICIALSDPSRTEEIASNAKVFATHNFSPLIRYNSILNEYKELLSS